MVKGINPLRSGGDEVESTEWMDFVIKYLIPGMLILAVIGVAMIQTQDSGGIGGGNIFKDMGSAMFSLK
jgi:hypothetical protein